MNENSASKECFICYYWHFTGKRFRSESLVSHGCHNILMMSFGINNSAILNIYDIDYRCIISGVSKSEAIRMMESSVIHDSDSL